MSIIYFIIVISILVFVHELGHLLSAKFFKVYCYEFAIGMGPKLISKKFKETTYSIRLLPVGGFVSMAGDNDNVLESKENIIVPESRKLNNLAPIKRIIVMLAGVFMNFIFAWFLFSLVLLDNGSYGLERPPIVGDVIVDSPAYHAGLLKDDRIVEVIFSDKRSIKPDNYDQILTFSAGNTDEVTYIVDRQGELLEFKITPYLKDDQYIVGVNLPEVEFVDINILNCVFYGLDFMMFNVDIVMTSLTHLLSGLGLDQLSGPVGMVQLTKEASSYGFMSLVLLAAILSINFSIMNMLPLPVLDGGRVLITVCEMIIGKSINKKLESLIMGISASLLILLMLFITFSDIFKLL